MPAVSDAFLDGSLNVLKTATRVDVCASTVGGNFANIASLTLANATISGSDFTGPVDDAATGAGRKVTFNGRSGNSITLSGTATKLVYSIPGSSAFVAEFDTASTALTSGGTVDIASHKYQQKDPT
jgi:hypothetical protein